MFIAHLPAGYILSQQLVKGRNALHKRWLTIGILIGSIAPDLDLIYFYTWGQRQTPHHEYIPHIPSFWLCFIAVGLLLRLSHKTRLSNCLLGLGLGGLLHTILDTPVGGIYWFMPFDDSMIRFSVVPKKYDVWVLNFILHWYFLCELAICAWASAVWIQQKRRKRYGFRHS